MRPESLLPVEKTMNDNFTTVHAGWSPDYKSYPSKEEWEAAARKLKAIPEVAVRLNQFDWIILFYGTNEFEQFHGTKEQAIKEATGDRRHLNCGRTGFGLVQGIPEIF